MTKPTESELDQHLKSLVDWERLAIHLPKMKHPDIDIIKKDEGDLAHRRLALYAKWLSVDPDASWNDVIQALETMDENTIASNLKEKLSIVTAEKPQVVVGKVKVSKNIVDELKSLDTTFVSITEGVKSEVRSNVENGRMSVSRLVSRTLEEKAYYIPELRSVQTHIDYFTAIQPHYSFLNCHLIIRLAVFLSEFIVKRAKEFKEKVVNPAKEYEERVAIFKNTTQVIDLHDTLDQFNPDSLPDTNLRTRVTIVLEGSWGQHNLWLVEELVKTLFGLSNHDECQWFRVRPGSLVVAFLVPKSLLMLFIVNSVKKIQFMRLIGVISLQVGSIFVLKMKNKKSFSFDNSLIRATKRTNFEVVQFLLKFMQVDVNKAKPFRTKVTVIPNNIFRLKVLQQRFDEIIHEVEKEIQNAVEVNKITIEELVTHITEKRPYVELYPGNTVHSFLQAIRPFYNFLNHSLAVTIAHFLGSRSSIALNAEIYSGEAETFKTIASVTHLRSSFHQYFQDSQPEGSIRVTIVLANVWHTCSISLVEKLMQNVFTLKHPDELQWFKVISGSLIVVFLAPKNTKKHLIENSKRKIEFMRLLGIISLRVGGDYVFKDGDHDYSIKKGIAEAKETDNDEAVKFLSTFKKDSIATTQQAAVDSNHNITFICDPDSTVLMIACGNSDTRLVKLLLHNKADPNIETEGKSTALMYASLVGNAKIVQLLLEHNANIDKINNWDETALFIACRYGHIKVVDTLLARKPNVNTKEHCGLTPIFTASRNGHLHLVRKLLDAKADPNIPDKAGGTPLLMACEIGDIQIVKLLLNAQADPNAQNINGSICLNAAVMHGYLEIFQSLIEANANPNIQDLYGTTPLHLACQTGRLQMTKALLRAQANPNIQDDEGATPVYIASKTGHVKVLESLLEAQADPNIPLVNGSTPLHIACSGKGHLQVVTILLEANANPNFQNSIGLTALMHALYCGHLEIFEALLKAKANPNIQSSAGLSPLYLACMHGNLKATKALIKAKADPNIQNIEGNTPLFMASQKGHVKVLETLIKANADPNIQSDGGLTALHVAIQEGHLLIVTRLLDANADPNIQNNKGTTALHVAVVCGYTTLVQLLLERGANPNITMREFGLSPLAFAKLLKKTDIVELLQRTS